MENNLKYLGVGLAYPLTLVNGKFITASDKELIEQSIYIILSTPVGERFMLPEFGSRLEELCFEQNEPILFNMLRLFIREALDNWEKRIKVEERLIQFYIEGETVMCVVKYKILNSNEIDSYIYPFYRTLGA